ncbi:MAG TPA: biotin/lipoyl-containing protein [Syntrophomonas sp.]|nr:biotin/lipoyl-containing protein [Syntrophomonas sp.]
MEKVLAPIPGKILEISVKEGQKVSAEDIVLILEAMKMENEVYCETDGVVEAINVKVGDSVAANDVLLIIK